MRYAKSRSCKTFNKTGKEDLMNIGQPWVEGKKEKVVGPIQLHCNQNVKMEDLRVGRMYAIFLPSIPSIVILILAPCTNMT